MAGLRACRAGAAAAAAAAVAAAAASLSDRAYADAGASRFESIFFRPQVPSYSPPPPAGGEDAGHAGGSGGLDPDALMRCAQAARELNSSRHAKELFDVMRKQEETRLAENEAEKVIYQVALAQSDIERAKKWAEEQRGIVEKQSQAKAQNLRYEDELARNRMKTDHETQRHQNVELVRMQEESTIRKEQARRAAEEQIQAQLRQTEKERAEIERETIRVKAMAEAEARALEAKLTADHRSRMLLEELKGETDRWITSINTVFNQIGGGLHVLLTDRNRLVMAVGGATALAAGVYTTRGGAKVMWGYINRILGQPSLIRESSIAKYPWSGILSKGKDQVLKVWKKDSMGEAAKASFDDIILPQSLKRRVLRLARATENTRSHQAPFRNMLFYGPPGTGKTMVAKEMARKSGLDYAMMTGGDVLPLGSQAVTKIHELFDWAKRSRKGLLLFIDEADAFLCERNSIHMSEAQRSALNALLFRTGDQSRDIVLVLATNRPKDLDSAITDRIDEAIEFPLPGEEERFQLLNLYLRKYLSSAPSDENEHEGNSAGATSKTSDQSWWKRSFKRMPLKISVKDLSEDVLREAARKTEGFSGREIAKLMASVQAIVYGSPDCVLDSKLFMEAVDSKVMEHKERINQVGG